MNKALSSTDILSKKHKKFDFEGEFLEAFGKPARHGVVFTWGNSGNGKNDFLLKLVKYLSEFDKVLWVELEEYGHDTFKEAWQRNQMQDCGRKIQVCDDKIEALIERLEKRQSQNIVVINSFQYTFMTFKDYLELKAKFPKKLFIINSQCEGKNPLGKTAVRVMYDAMLKIWIEGYKAFSKGRYIGPNGGEFIIWDEGAMKYWGTI